MLCTVLIIDWMEFIEYSVMVGLLFCWELELELENWNFLSIVATTQLDNCPYRVRQVVREHQKTHCLKRSSIPPF